MEVILKRDVPNVGRIGEIVRVKNGFARNYLLPRSLAVVADAGNVKSLEHHKRVIEREKVKVKEESEAKAGDVEKLKITIKKRFNDQDKMFGSVTPLEVTEELKKKGHSFDKRDVEIPEIETAGTYKVKVRLPGDVFTELELKVEAIKEKKAKKKAATKKAAEKVTKTEEPATEEPATKEEKASEEA